MFSTMSVRILFFAGLVFTLLQCCKVDPFVPVDRGLDYFPLFEGKFIEYQVDSIIFDDFGGGNIKDTFKTFVREEIGSFTIDQFGDTTYVLERSVRKSSENPWLLQDIWTVGRNLKEAFKTEENQRLVVLSFPLNENSIWNPIAYINPSIQVLVGTETIAMYSNWSSAVESIDIAGEVGDFTWEPGNVLTVVQADDDNGIELRFVREQYVRDIGLVYREMRILDSRCKRLGDLGPCLGQSWDEHGEKGFYLTQRIIAHN